MARFLFVVPPLTGHTNPTVPVADALRERGHDVAWVGHPGKVRPLLPPGARLIELDDRVPEEMLARVQDRANRVRGIEGLKFLWEEFLVPLARAMHPGVEAAVKSWGPDVLVVDQQAIGGMLAARRLSIPWATFATTSASVVEPLLDLPRVLQWRDDLLADLQRNAGLQPRPEPDRSPHLVVVFSTPELVGTSSSFPNHYVFVGPSLALRPRRVDFPWDALRDDPKVLVSLGTVNAERGARFYRVAAEAMAEEPVQVILVAPRELAGEVPDNFLRRDFVPQLELLPHLRAVVCHGGHNTVCESLWHGVPLVVAPIKDDQPVVANQVVEAGAGLRVKFGRVRADGFRTAVRRVLDEPSFRESAARIGATFREAGGATRAARRLVEMTEGLPRRDE